MKIKIKSLIMKNQSIAHSNYLIVSLLSKEIMLGFHGYSKNSPEIDYKDKILTIFTKKDYSKLSSYGYSIYPSTSYPVLKEISFKVDLDFAINGIEYKVEGTMDIENPEKELRFLLKQIPLQTWGY